jgi:hypothetical protein
MLRVITPATAVCKSEAKSCFAKWPSSHNFAALDTAAKDLCFLAKTIHTYTWNHEAS